MLRAFQIPMVVAEPDQATARPSHQTKDTLRSIPDNLQLTEVVDLHCHHTLQTIFDKANAQCELNVRTRQQQVKMQVSKNTIQQSLIYVQIMSTNPPHLSLKIST